MEMREDDAIVDVDRRLRDLGPDVVELTEQAIEPPVEIFQSVPEFALAHTLCCQQASCHVT